MFRIDYERANPMAKQEGAMRYKAAKKEKGLISNRKFQINIKVTQNKDIMSSYFNRPPNFGKGFL